MKAYRVEEEAFKRTVRLVSVNDVPRNANKIAFHILYKLKISDDGIFNMKARTAPHGNEDSYKDSMKNDCCLYAPTGIRVLLSIATINFCRLSKADVKSSFLQAEDTQHDVYAIPSYESIDRLCHFWLLLAATYGLVKANTKWQRLSDKLLIHLGSRQMTWLPQVFYHCEHGKFVAVISKFLTTFT